MKVLQSGAAFCYYKVGQLLLQNGTRSFITKLDNFITKWDRYYKTGQLNEKVVRVLQSGTIITKCPSVNMNKSTEKQRNPYSKNLFFVICSVLI